MKKIVSFGVRAACALLFTAATACAGSDGPSDPGATRESADDLSIFASSFVTLRPDLRRCAAPMCGGYFVRDVNRQGAERYVSGLDFTESRLPVDAVEDVQSAPPNELVLYGHLGLEDPRFHTRPFAIHAAFRGMPSVTANATDAFYQAHARKPPIQCFVAPCPNEIATLLNTGREEEFDRISVDRAALPWVDKGWLASRVAAHQAVVTGTFAQGQLLPGGYEKVLEATQVFVRLPDRIGPCPERPQFLCTEGTVVIQERTEDRCMVQVGCVVPNICPQTRYMPECSAGYTLASWAEAPSGCPTYACDPTFVIPR